jgi:RanGAP1 C-terminal domain
LKSLRNFVLIQLGLLKCEDKTFTPKYNVKACRHALQQAIAHNCIPKDEQNTFNVFMEQVNGK